MHFVYSAAELEAIAVQTLSEYGGAAAVDSREPLDVDAFAELFLGATLDFGNLSADGHTDGFTALSDGVVCLWDPARGTHQMVKTKKKTIFLDVNASHEGRGRFTLAHECAHIILHRPLEADFSPGEDAVLTRVDLGFKTRPRSNPCDPAAGERWREWQANHLAGALLMPIRPVLRMRAEYFNDDPLDMVAQPLSDRLMETFGVSRSAARTRLSHLTGYELTAPAVA
ncbi:ImmA/IrrE family metallo-endopeptidase [Actinomyces minihominis]|uniref:ImmA/IrrE family metallo-endopeptidase n=1 Tax=Actinomyces minihominis TaxID=2002838 RepID=UPI000C08788B|nr:ImmA/IrrE family metallo-endopeptidase [Actinomyces minihominis]